MPTCYHTQTTSTFLQPRRQWRQHMIQAPPATTSPHEPPSRTRPITPYPRSRTQTNGLRHALSAHISTRDIPRSNSTTASSTTQRLTYGGLDAAKVCTCDLLSFRSHSHPQYAVISRVMGVRPWHPCQDDAQRLRPCVSRFPGRRREAECAWRRWNGAPAPTCALYTVRRNTGVAHYDARTTRTRPITRPAASASLDVPQYGCAGFLTTEGIACSPPDSMYKLCVGS